MKQMPLIIVLVLIIVIGWYFMGPSSNSNYVEPKTPILFLTLDSFYKKYPNWGANSQTQKEFTDSLNKTFIRNGVKKIYEGVVFKLNSIDKTKDKEFPYIAFLEFDNTGNYLHKDERTYYFAEQSVLLDKKAVDTLREYGRYYIYGNVIKVTNPAEISSDVTVTLPSVLVAVDSIKRAE